MMPVIAGEVVGLGTLALLAWLPDHDLTDVSVWAFVVALVAGVVTVLLVAEAQGYLRERSR